MSTSLASTAPRHTLVVPEQGVEPGWLALPARPGVAVFEDLAGRTILIATTADLRALARRRLGSSEGVARREPGKRDIAEQLASRPHADHRSITRCVIGVEVTSALEADIVYLSEARDRMPATHQTVSERWRAWFVHVDPGAKHPQWSKTNLAGLVAPRAASACIGTQGIPPGAIIGPFPDKDAAGRLIERMIDAFDLCRYHSILVQAPCAVACAYKEMNRCPAPCDGTEPLDGYQARTREAIEHLTGDRTRLKALLAAQMTAAAAESNFEQAGACKQRLARLDGLDAPAFQHATVLDEWRTLLVLPGPSPRIASVLVFARGIFTTLGAVTLPLDHEAAGILANKVMSVARIEQAMALSPEQLDSIAVLSRWLHMPKARRGTRGEAIPLTKESTQEQLTMSIGIAATSIARRKAALPPPIEERELEVLSS